VEDSELLNQVVRRGYPRLADDAVLLNPDCRLRRCDPSAWEFHLGGYRVIERWLKVRRGRSLSASDIGQLHGLIEIAATTMEIARQIDQEVRDAW
jgi:hypothetical protein